MPGRLFAALFGCALFVCLPTAAADDRDLRSFQDWRQLHEPLVQALLDHLTAAGLEQEVPLHELLKSASDWRKCEAAAYAVPPREQWPAVLSTLQLVRELHAQRILDRFQVHSAYRDRVLNRCAGGASRSAHTRSFAIDLTPLAGPDPSRTLCEF